MYMKRSTGLKSQCTAITEEPLLAANIEVLSSNEDLLPPKLKKKKKFLQRNQWVSGKAGHEKG